MADDMNLEIVLEAIDNTQAGFSAMDQALQAVQQLADELSKSFSSFAASIDSAMNQAATATESVVKPLEDVSKAVEELSKPFEEAAKSAEDAAQAAATIGKPLEDVTKAANDAAEAMNQTTTAADGVTKAVEEIATNAEKAGQQAADGMKPMSDEIEKIRQTILLTEDELKKLVDMSSIKTLEGGVAEAGQLPTSELKKLYEQQSGNKAIIAQSGAKHDEGLFSMQGQMDSMYAGMALGAVSAPVDAGLGASIDQFAKFDQAMRLVNQEMQLSQSGFQDLEQRVLSLSNSTGISAQELSNGLYNVVASGVKNTSDALTLLQTAAEGAKAGNTDLNTATQALNAVMGAYGMNASQASQIMDVMFTAVNNGQMHFTDLAKSVGASATSAATAGVSYTELAAAQATLTNVGKNAESASQNLNSLIMGIIAPTSQASKEAQKLGIEWDAQALKAHGLSYMIDEASKATNGNSEELKKLVPNQRAYMAVLALGQNAHQQYTDTLNKMKNAHGATAQAIEEYDKGAGDEIEKMKSSVTNAGIALGSALAPAIEKVTSAISDLAHWFSNLSPQTQEFIGITLALVGGLTALGAIFFGAISGIGALKMGLDGLAAAFKGAAVAEDVLTASTEAAETTNPIGWIMLAVSGVILLTSYVISHWTEIKSFLVKTWDEIKNVATNVWTGVSGFFERTWGAIKSTTENIWNGIKSFFQKWGMDILYAIPIVGLVALIATHWEEIKTDTINSWNSLTNSIKNIWSEFTTWLSDAAQKIVQWVIQAFEWMYNHNYYFKYMVDNIVAEWNWLHDTTITVWNALKEFFTTIWNEVSAIASSIWNGVKNFFATLWDGIKTIAETFWNNEVNFYKAIWNVIVTAASAIWTPIENFFSGIWSSVSSAASSWWNTIKNNLSNLWNDSVNDAKNIWGGIKTFFSNLWTEAEQWGANLIHMFADGISNAAHEVEDAVKNVAGKIASFLGFHSPTETGPASDSDKWAPNFVSMFASGLVAGAPQVATAAQSLAQPLSDALGNLGSGGASIQSISKDQMDAVTKYGQLIINAKQDYANAAQSNDAKAMQSASDMANQYRQQMQQMGIDSSLFASNLTVSQTMDNIAKLAKASTQSTAQNYTTMTSGMLSDNSSLTNSVNTLTGSMQTSWTSSLTNVTGSVATFKTQLLTAMATMEKAVKNASDSMAKSMVTAFDSIAESVKNTADMAISEIARMSSAMQSVGMAQSQAPSAAIAGGYGGGGGAPVFNISVNASGNVTKNERDLADSISAAIIDKMKKQGKF